MRTLASAFVFPKLIANDIIIYSLPLFLLSCTRKEKTLNYWLSVLGVIAGMIPISSKSKLIAASLLVVVQVLYDGLYYFSFGFALFQAYNSNILLSRQHEINGFIMKIEIIGWLCAEITQTSKIVMLVLSTLVVYIAATCKPPCNETDNPLDEMVQRVDSANLITTELKLISVKTKRSTFKQTFKNNLNWHKYFPCLFEILYLTGKNKILILLCSFYSFQVTEHVLIAIGVLSLFDFYWEPLILVLNGDYVHPLFRVISTGLICKIIREVQNNLKT